MTNRNQIWKKANSSSEQRCIEILQIIFPSLSYELVYDGSIISKIQVTTKKDALKRIRQGLNKITEVEAGYYISILNQKKKPSQIKF